MIDSVQVLDRFIGEEVDGVLALQFVFPGVVVISLSQKSTVWPKLNVTQ